MDSAAPVLKIAAGYGIPEILQVSSRIAQRAAKIDPAMNVLRVSRNVSFLRFTTAMR